METTRQTETAATDQADKIAAKVADQLGADLSEKISQTYITHRVGEEIVRQVERMKKIGLLVGSVLAAVLAYLFGQDLFKNSVMNNLIAQLKSQVEEIHTQSKDLHEQTEKAKSSATESTRAIDKLIENAKSYVNESKAALDKLIETGKTEIKEQISKADHSMQNVEQTRTQIAADSLRQTGDLERLRAEVRDLVHQADGKIGEISRIKDEVLSEKHKAEEVLAALSKYVNLDTELIKARTLELIFLEKKQRHSIDIANPAHPETKYHITFQIVSGLKSTTLLITVAGQPRRQEEDLDKSSKFPIEGTSLSCESVAVRRHVFAHDFFILKVSAEK